MSSWVDIGLTELDDFGFGINAGWSLVKNGHAHRTFETPHFTAEVFTRPLIQRSVPPRTSVFLDFEEYVVDLIKMQDVMAAEGWPSRKTTPWLYAQRNKARLAQRARFMPLYAQMCEESPEFAKLFDGWQKTVHARGSGNARVTPQLWGAAHVALISI